MNAANDLRYSSWLLACYAGSLLASIGFSWLFSMRPHMSMVLPGAILAYAACEVLWLHPEQPIHLFPTMIPWRPLQISIGGVAIAAFFVYFQSDGQHPREA